MRARLAVLTMVALVASLGPALARADVVEPYQEPTYAEESQYACGWAILWDEEARYESLYVCGSTADVDGDGTVDMASIGVSRTVCTYSGRFQHCSSTWGNDGIDPSQITIDIDAGVARFSGAIDDCPVMLDLHATSQQSGATYIDRYNDRRVETRHLRLRTTSGSEDGHGTREAEGTGTACDWMADGAFDDAYIDRYHSSGYQEGVAINPEQLPILGGAIERSTVNSQRYSSDLVCVDFFDQDTYDSAYSCGQWTDQDDDGTVDDIYADASWWSCDDDFCDSEYFGVGGLTTDDVWVDVADGSGWVDAELDGCHVSFAVSRDPNGYEGQWKDRWGQDGVGPSLDDPGSVTLGRSGWNSGHYRYGTVAPGADVCGWDFTGWAEEGGTSRVRSSTDEHRIAVRPTNLVPGG